ncbi:HAD family hydrolase [Cohnella thailandensis]|uniref:HAD family phosphatase n=1 Tax=Cohnella thailandensis TaxID=557557 RepID=A0A841SRF1_9BACL|nr:HAD family phosphatase [Cohnella thailandensis]MBB6634514.1 HAD family phosphatase [Cohnella thailandensis]MBP1972932.1 phosphoglycolate phosphatase [Cohnella thailandensis]
MPILRAAGTDYRIDGILFDKDGTLLDFIYTWGNWSERLLARFSAFLQERKLPPPDADLDALWGALRANDGNVSDYDRNGPLAMGTVDEILTILAWQGYRSGLSWAEAKTLAADAKRWADERLEASRSARLLPHVLPFLEECRRSGLPLAVVTADDTLPAVKHLEWLGIREFFSAVIGTDQVKQGKPYPDMALLACDRLGLDGGRFAVIGDTEGDIRMAKEAGAAAAIRIAAIGDRGSAADGFSPASEADAIVSSLRELSIIQEEGPT